MPVKVELQVSMLVNGRPIWMRAKTVSSVLTAQLSGTDYDKVVLDAAESLEKLCRLDPAQKAAPPTNAKAKSVKKK